MNRQPGCCVRSVFLVLFGSRQVWQHSEANLRKYLEALIYRDYNVYPGTLFLNDLGSRHGIMAQNGISLILYEAYVLQVCEEHQRNTYAANLRSILTGSDGTFIKLFIGSIPTAYYSIIEPFISQTAGLSRSYGDLLR